MALNFNQKRKRLESYGWTIDKESNYYIAKKDHITITAFTQSQLLEKVQKHLPAIT